MSLLAFACVVLLMWTPGLSSGQEKESDKNKRHILLTLSPFYLRRFPESSVSMCFYCITWPFFFFLQDGYCVPDTVPNIHMYCIYSS